MNGTRVARATLGALCALAIFAAAATAEEDVPFVDGKLWLASVPGEKQAYLIGISNLMSAEYAFQKEMGPPPDGQTTIQRLYEEIDDVTLDEAVERIDAWYARNPGKKDMTVLVGYSVVIHCVSVAVLLFCHRGKTRKQKDS